MPYRVSRETLLLLAGLFWTLAGVNVLRLGIRYWMDNPGYFLFKLSEMLVIFFVFLGFIRICTASIRFGLFTNRKRIPSFPSLMGKVGWWWA